MAVAEVDLDMDDIFGDGRDVEELLDQPVDQDERDDEAVEAGPTATQELDMEVLDRLPDVSKVGAKKRVLKPQPKLDANRLQSSRGLPALTKTFEDFKFQGKGHEKEDLLKMMSTLEHWAHRLFPKASFDDFIERLEKLGNKRAVQTTVKRIRMDMPILNEDFVGDNEAETMTEQADENDENNHNGDNIPEFNAEEAYEEMIRQEREEQELQRATQQENEEYDPSNSPIRSPATNRTMTEMSNTSSTGVTPSAGSSKSLTAEQQERIERNKRLAMEKRMKKMGITPGKSPASPAASNRSSQSEAPVSDASQSKAPVSDASQSKAPVSDASQSDAPVSDASQSKAPVSDASHLKAPVSDASQSKAPVSDASQSKAGISDDMQNGPSIGSQRPDNSELANELLHDLNEETS